MPFKVTRVTEEAIFIRPIIPQTKKKSENTKNQISKKKEKIKS